METTIEGKSEFEEHPASGATGATNENEEADRKHESGNSPKPTEEKTVHSDIEEGSSKYHPGGFHPVYIDDVYNGRYKVLSKIGYGVYSTVWLVKDLHQESTDGTEYYAMKVLSAMCYGTGEDIFELEILRHLRSGDEDQVGYRHICHLINDFTVKGPNGNHVCLVFELMGETLNFFGGRFVESRIPYAVMRRFAIQLICAVDFAHCHGVIHTDIQPSNIFVKFRNRSQIESYLSETPVPDQDREEQKYTPVPSSPLSNYYLKEVDNLAELDIALGDWGVATWADKHLSEHIQPVALRAPEVLLRAPWDHNVDWWNFGAILLEMYRAIRMFSGLVPPDGHYEVKQHISEIVDLFGPFPKSLLEKGDKELVREVFDDQGGIIIKDGNEKLSRPSLDHEVWTPGLNEEDREDFVSFLRFVMKVDPAERPEGVDMLRHVWIQALPPLPEGEEEEAGDSGEES
ncbi:serine-threonineeeee protein kinase [Cladorrhinum sp. PSN332]|nr:serine-threonineeeee protein kinase [Cladorrhinum sp. PSN332]